MKFLNKYKYPLTATLGLIAIFGIFQNGTCNNNGSYSAGQNNGSGTGGGGGGVSTFTASPLTATVAPGGTVRISGVGGTAPYAYVKSFGDGSISLVGVYTAPAFATTAGITVTDVNGNSAYVNITVEVAAQSALSLVAAASTVNTGGTVQLTASGGSNSYRFSKVSGGGQINTSGLYTADNTAGTVILMVTDNGTLLTAQVSITVQNGQGAFTAASTNSQMTPATWAVIHAIDQYPDSCYSSLGGNSFNPAVKPYVMLTIGSASSTSDYPISKLKLTARRVNGQVIAFPTSYQIKVLNTDGSWTLVGTFNTQPDFDGVARIDFSQTYYTKKVVIIAQTLAKDNTGYYYFQLCDISQ